MNLFLVPANPKNAALTIRQTVPFSSVRHFVDENEFRRLTKALDGKVSINCWAMSEGRRSVFEKMERGDMAFITVAGTGKFQYVGEIACKTESLELGNRLWGCDQDRPWNLVYFFRSLSVIEAGKYDILSALGYDNPNDELAGVRRVSRDSVAEIYQRFGGPDGFLRAINDASAGEHPLRLRSAISRTARALEGPKKVRRKRKPDDVRDILRAVIENGGYAFPPAIEVAGLVSKVETRSDGTVASKIEEARRALEPYRKPQ